eukprot:16448052-Heterocapsa_arctica.AAC.1
MGGPASPFLWNLAYDPIVCALSIAVGIIPPTYVDDLAALAHGPEHVMRAEICLIVAGKLAGLHTDNHTCSWVEGEGDFAEVAATLTALPVEVRKEKLPSGAGFSVHGLPANFTHRLLANHNHPRWRNVRIIADKACHCKVKTVVIPSEDCEGWARALIDSVYGAHSVRANNPYLGVTIAGHDPSNLGLQCGTFSPEALELIENGTWGTTTK